MLPIKNFLAMQVRKDLGVPDDVKLVIFNFGGQVRYNLGCHDILVYVFQFFLLTFQNFWIPQHLRMTKIGESTLTLNGLENFQLTFFQVFKIDSLGWNSGVYLVIGYMIFLVFLFLDICFSWAFWKIIYVLKWIPSPNC